MKPTNLHTPLYGPDDFSCIAFLCCVSTAVLFYQCQLEEGDSLVGLSHYYSPIWRNPFLPGHWLLTTEAFLWSSDYLAPVRGHFCAKSSTILLSWPEGAPCVKIKRDPGRKNQHANTLSVRVDLMML